MITPNELRIGNYVNHPGESGFNYPNGIIQVEEVFSDGVNRTHGDDTVYESQNLYGVPLTEEWLLKFGFEKRSHVWRGGSVSDDYFWKGKYNVGLETIFFFGRRSNENEPEWIANIEFVHKLQNLFYALTGQELTTS